MGAQGFSVSLNAPALSDTAGDPRDAPVSQTTTIPGRSMGRLATKSRLACHHVNY